MAEVKVGELRSVVEAVRQIVLDWDGFVSNVEALAREHEEYRLGGPPRGSSGSSRGPRTPHRRA